MLNSPRRIGSTLPFRPKANRRYIPSAQDRFEDRVMPTVTPLFSIGTSDPSTPHNPGFTPTETASPGPYDLNPADGVDRIYVPNGGVTVGTNTYSMKFISSLDVPATVTFMLYKVGSVRDDTTILQDYLFNQMLVDMQSKTVPAAGAMQEVTQTFDIQIPLICNYQVDVFVSYLNGDRTSQQIVTQFGADGVPRDPGLEYTDPATGQYTILGSIVHFGCDETGTSKSQGWYKKAEHWPPLVTGLTIGDKFYLKADLINFLKTSSAGGSPVKNAVNQLITAKLNVIGGSTYGTFAADQAVDRAISTIDKLLQDRGVNLLVASTYSGISNSSADGQLLNTLKGILEDYNLKDE